jgi:hypothetical protein
MLPQGGAYVAGAKIGLRISSGAARVWKFAVDSVVGFMSFWYGISEGLFSRDVAERVIYAVEKEKVGEIEAEPPLTPPIPFSTVRRDAGFWRNG